MRRRCVRAAVTSLRNVSVLSNVLLTVHFIDLGLVMAARDRQRLQMITTLMLSSIEIVDRVVQQGIVAIDAVIVRIVETRDAHGLLTRVLRLLRTDQMNLATHLDAVVESVDRVSTVVSLAVPRDFALVHVVTLYVATC